MKDWLNQCHLGDCLEVMRGMPDNCVDSIVTDPPYGIRFMGKSWDGADIVAKAKDRASYSTDESPRAGATGGHRSIAAEAGKYDLSPFGMLAFQQFSEEWAREAIRVLKPGGYLLSFASTRTYHRMTCGIEAAGFEIRDQLGWMFGSGFPKSHNGEWGGTALKPAWEPICMARKPLIGTVEANWRKHGTGALNIDGCRVVSEHRPIMVRTETVVSNSSTENPTSGATSSGELTSLGRWPANLIHDGSDEVLAGFPQSAGQQGDVRGTEPSGVTNGIYGDFAGRVTSAARNDTGSAARFFYCAKASAEDRNEGCGAIDERLAGCLTMRQDAHAQATGQTFAHKRNHHPTVKPTDLMRYLCRLVTPAGGIVLDPFMGSGSTGRAAVLEGFKFIGIEREAEYVEIARVRIASAMAQGFQTSFDLEAA